MTSDGEDPSHWQPSLFGDPAPPLRGEALRSHRGRWLDAAAALGQAIASAPTLRLHLAGSVASATTAARPGDRGVGTQVEHALADRLDHDAVADAVSREACEAAGELPHLGTLERVELGYRGGNHQCDWVVEATGDRGTLTLGLNLKTHSGTGLVRGAEAGSIRAVVKAATGVHPDDGSRFDLAATLLGLASGDVSVRPGDYAVLIAGVDRYDDGRHRLSRVRWQGLLSSVTAGGAYAFTPHRNRPETLNFDELADPHAIPAGFHVPTRLAASLMPRCDPRPYLYAAAATGDRDADRDLATVLAGLDVAELRARITGERRVPPEGGCSSKSP